MLEIVRPRALNQPLRAAIFDFDGTLSLIRSGWLPMMIDMFMEEIGPLRGAEAEMELRERMRDIILQLTGKETIHQMNALAGEVCARTGTARSGDEYKSRFLERLLALVNGKLKQLRSGEATPDSFMVPCARTWLDFLQRESLDLYLASGTDQANLNEEAEALGLTRYFGEHIYGARTDGEGFTKAALVHHLISERGYNPETLVAFGDGFVEVNEVSRAGGITVGVASDEPACMAVDDAKRRYLLKAGANFMVPNFCGWSDLAALLFPGRLSLM